jgi:F-type H+-transporting ATPase subunit gamma
VATLREIRGRISGIRNTQKITKAMKMVAAAKLRRAQERAMAARPYARKISELLRHLVTKVDLRLHPLLTPREVRRVCVIVVTADRGLCGAFNANIIKAAVQHIEDHYAEHWRSGRLHLMTVGKKGSDFFSKRSYPVLAKYVGVFQDLSFVSAQGIVDRMTKEYLQGTFDRVDVVYNEFKSVVQQNIVIEQLLPVPPEELTPLPGRRGLAQIEYIYEPTSGEILDALVPRHLGFQMWRVLLESNSAEQGARMTAMENATENARELIRDLTLAYNNARQAAITKELLEIVSGAEALRKSG